jgi:hypothetical protein
LLWSLYPLTRNVTSEEICKGSYILPHKITKKTTYLLHKIYGVLCAVYLSTPLLCFLALYIIIERKKSQYNMVIFSLIFGLLYCQWILQAYCMIFVCLAIAEGWNLQLCVCMHTFHTNTTHSSQRTSILKGLFPSVIISALYHLVKILINLIQSIIVIIVECIDMMVLGYVIQEDSL